MCGIWAFLSKKQIETFGPLYDAFMQIKRRGPEYSSFDLINPHTLIGFHRLAIMDISADGNQPFKLVRPDKSYVYAVCNGEIYDYEKLKKKYNLQTKSNSDCEILIPLYEKLGAQQMMPLLGSEFACMIVDVKSNGETVVTIARDPLGVRPLFYSLTNETLCLSSEMKGMCDIERNINVFPPGHIMTLKFDSAKFETSIDPYYYYQYKQISPSNMQNVYSEIRARLTKCVEKRLMADRPFGCLLSGGLDSSLVCAIAKSLVPVDKTFPAFTIAFESGSTDLPYAQMVADYLGLEHHVIMITEEEALDQIEETIWATETWDITTIRASVMQKLVAKYVKQYTDIKVLLVGENSDELFLGYLYENYAPSIDAAHEDSIRLVKDVHRFDGLRTDRTMAFHGLEVRTPFADPDIVDYVLSLPPSFVVPQITKFALEADEKNPVKMEKALLRDAFKDSSFLPNEVLYRRKEAFSDAVSEKKRSWYEVIQEKIDKLITDKEFEEEKGKFEWCPPFTKESYYYRKIFTKLFGSSNEKAKTIPYYWMPKWTSETKDPSARTLSIY